VTPQEARGIKPIGPPPTTTSGTPEQQQQQQQQQQQPRASQLTNATPSSLFSSTASTMPRAKHPSDERKALKRNPKKALEVLLHACNELQHGGACHNAAVMYSQGDDGVPQDEVKAQYYKEKTEKLLNSGAGILPF
jgi:TPR repeat protein